MVRESNGNSSSKEASHGFKSFQSETIKQKRYIKKKTNLTTQLFGYKRVRPKTRLSRKDLFLFPPKLVQEAIALRRRANRLTLTAGKAISLQFRC